MLLDQILKNVDHISVEGATDRQIDCVAYHTKNVTANCLFVCKSFDFKPEYVVAAVEKGAVCVIFDQDLPVPPGVTAVKVENARIALAQAADAFYGHPSGKCRVVGITGTKGKTTTSFMIKSILEAAGYKTGLIGSIYTMIGDDVRDADTTTPESLDLQKLLAQMVSAQATDVVMEVSSQGLWLNRVHSTDFHTGVFTNITSDHIGPKEHANFDEYLAAKKELFRMCKYGVFNVDSPYTAGVMEYATCRKMLTFGLENRADVTASDICNEPDGIRFEAQTPWGRQNIKMKMIGKFNVYNALAAITVCGNSGIGLDDIARGLSDVIVKGRVEFVPNDMNATVLIDHAHNKLALESTLTELRAYYGSRRLVSVFGCGGNRDKARRYEMGQVSGELADLTIITSDNPRTENPEDILADIETGMKKTSGSYVKMIDRTQAIRYALETSKPGDVILLAGKGHEMYQDFGSHKIDFDERKVVKEIATELTRR